MSLLYIINKFELKASPKTDKLCDEMFMPQNFGAKFILKCLLGLERYMYQMFMSSNDPCMLI